MATTRGPRIATNGLIRMYDLSQFGGWGAPLTYDSTSWGYYYAASIKDLVTGRNLYVLNNPSIPLHVKNGVRCRSTVYNNPEDVNSGNYNLDLTDNVDIPIYGSSNRTVERWVYLTSSSPRYDGYGNLIDEFCFMRWGYPSNVGMCVFGIKGADRLFIMGWDANPTIYSSYVPSLVGRWVQIAYTNNGSSVSFYVNGEAAGTGTFGFNTGSGQPYWSITGARFTGPLAYDTSARIYNRQLSAAEIKSNFLAQKGRFGI